MSSAPDHDDDIALAGEYALHLMDAADRRAFDKRLADEPALRALLKDWDEGLVPLADQIAEFPPPRHLKASIEGVLFAAPHAERRRRLSWLKLGSGVLGGLALALVLLVALPRTPVSTAPAYTAALTSDDRSLIVRASLDAGSHRLLVTRDAGAAPAGRVLELWLIAPTAPNPISLGVLPDTPDAAIELPDPVMALVAGSTLAITDEPPGGAPNGVPTGTILAAAPVTTL